MVIYIRTFYAIPFVGVVFVFGATRAVGKVDWWLSYIIFLGLVPIKQNNNNFLAIPILSSNSDLMIHFQFCVICKMENLSYYLYVEYFHFRNLEKRSSFR